MTRSEWERAVREGRLPKMSPEEFFEALRNGTITPDLCPLCHDTRRLTDGRCCPICTAELMEENLCPT